jgi:hypothetical protein
MVDQKNTNITPLHVKLELLAAFLKTLYDTEIYDYMYVFSV